MTCRPIIRHLIDLLQRIAFREHKASLPIASPLSSQRAAWLASAAIHQRALDQDTSLLSDSLGPTTQRLLSLAERLAA